LSRRSYVELAGEINRLANALKRLGRFARATRSGDLPADVRGGGDRHPRGGAHRRGVLRRAFSGYGAQAVASRLDGCGARVLITADAFARRGQAIPLKRTADEAVSASLSVEHVIVYRRGDGEVPWKDGRDLWWHELVAKESRGLSGAPGRPPIIRA